MSSGIVELHDARIEFPSYAWIYDESIVTICIDPRSVERWGSIDDLCTFGLGFRYSMNHMWGDFLDRLSSREAFKIAHTIFKHISFCPAIGIKRHCP